MININYFFLTYDSVNLSSPMKTVQWLPWNQQTTTFNNSYILRDHVHTYMFERYYENTRSYFISNKIIKVHVN